MRVTAPVITAAAILSAAMFTISHAAHAAGPRSFVSTVGIDNPSCSSSMPCRSFAAAIATTSTGGEVIVVDSGGYGTVTITKSISIIAPSGVHAGVSVASGNGVGINGNNLAVVLRGLTINGIGGSRGIQATGGGTVVSVEDCVVSNMTDDGILAFLIGSLTVRSSTVRGNGSNGIEIVGGRGSIENVRIEQNDIGLYATANAYVSVTRSIVRANAHQGAMIVGANSGDVSHLSIDASEISDNGATGVELFAQGAGREARLVLTRSTIVRNLLDGVLSNVLDGGSGRMDLGDNQVTANAAIGIENFSINAAVAEVRAWGNRVGQNGVLGIRNFGNGLFETIGNNMVRGNFGGNLGEPLTVQPGD